MDRFGCIVLGNDSQEKVINRLNSGFDRDLTRVRLQREIPESLMVEGIA